MVFVFRVVSVAEAALLVAVKAASFLQGFEWGLLWKQGQEGEDVLGRERIALGETLVGPLGVGGRGRGFWGGGRDDMCSGDEGRVDGDVGERGEDGVGDLGGESAVGREGAATHGG